MPTHAHVLLCLFLLAAPAFAQPGVDEAAKDPALFLKTARTMLKWDEPAEPAHIVGPIYFVGTQGLSSWLITTSAGHIVLNTGMPGSGPMIEASIKKLGFDPREIKLLLLGHAHVDHVGGHAYLQKVSGAEVAVLREEAELLASGGAADFHYAAYPEFGFDAVEPGRILRDGDTLKLGEVTMTARLTCGHTKGSTTWITSVVDDGKVYKVVFPDGTSVNPGYRVAQDASYPGIGDDFRRTFHTLEMLRPDIWLSPHTVVFDYEGKRARGAQEGAAAWVDPEGYRKWVVAARAKFEAAVDAEPAAPAP